VEHELSELPIAIETDRAHLDGYPSSIPAPQCALHLGRCRPFSRNGFYQCAAMILEFGRDELEEVPSGHVLCRDPEHPEH
jgi:hypothetical protein